MLPSPRTQAFLVLLLLALTALACNSGATPQPAPPPAPAPDNLEWAPDPNVPTTRSSAVPAAQAQSTAKIDVLLIADADYGSSGWQTPFFNDVANLINKAFPPGSQYQSLRQQFKFYVGLTQGSS